MYVGRDFDVSDQSESEVYSLNFVNDLQSGETILSVVFALTVSEGTDADVATRLDGDPGLINTIAMQRITGLLPGVVYALQATVTTSLGNNISLWSRIPCEVIA